jgi:hypothetical protein
MLWLKVGLEGPTCQARQPSFLAAPTLGITDQLHRPSLTRVWNGFRKYTKPWPAGPTWLSWAQALCHIIPSCHIVCDYLILDIMKICMDFGPYDAFPSPDVPEMVNQQNWWNLLVVSTYLLYLEWNVAMLAVNICILWLPTPPPPHTLRVLLVPEQKKRIKSWA